MKPNHNRFHESLRHDLADLKLHRLAEIYPEVLDEAARRSASPLEILAELIGAEATARSQRALERRIQRAGLPKRKTLEEYDFSFPQRIPKQTILRLFDCDFVAQHACAVFVGPTGTGKTHLLNALGYTACDSAGRPARQRPGGGDRSPLHPRGRHDQHPDHRPHPRHPGEILAGLHQCLLAPPR